MGQIRSFTEIVGTGGFVNSLCNRPFKNSTAVVVVNPLAVGGEYRAVIIVYGHGKVCPPHKHLRKFGAVVNTNLCFYVTSALIDGYTRHTLHSAKGFNLACPDGFTAIRVVFLYSLKGHVGGGSVVLGPVKLDTSGNPRSCKTYKCGLYNLVIINKIVISHLVKSTKYLTAQCWHNLSFYILVFKGVYIVFNIGFFVRNTVAVGYGVNPARRTLIGLVFKEHRQLVCLFGNISGYNLFLIFNAYF